LSPVPTAGTLPPVAAHETPQLRVVHADDSLLVREAVGAIVGEAPGMALVAACEDLPSLMTAVDEGSPDVVVTDIRMPPTFTDEGIAAATQLRDSHPDLGVVILSQDVDPEYILGLFGSGSDSRAYLLKERLRDRRELVDAIRTVARGGSVIDPKVVEPLIVMRPWSESSRLAQLTDREWQVLREIASGEGNPAIARALHLSKRSVEKYVHGIFTKLGLSESEDVSRRVMATLIFLAAEGSMTPSRRRTMR
jgi:DNA-binding NarL/FixJ family response regulator